MKVLLPLFFTFFFTFNAQAVIRLLPVSGVSDTIFDAATGQITFVAGFNGTCANPGTGLCDTCTNSAPPACTGDAGCCGVLQCQTCNTKAVTNSTLLVIPFTSDTTLAGRPQLSLNASSPIPSTSVGAGGQFVFSAPWEQVCRALTELSNCDCEMIRAGTCSIFNSGVLNRTPTLSIQGGTDTLVLNFRLYAQSQVLASAGQSGALTQFSIYPGDEKVYMEEPNIVGYTEGSINANVKQIRVFIGTGSFNNAYVQNDGTGLGETIEPSFLSVDGNGIDQVIDGLENDIVYHFRTASVDEAGNIYAFMDNAYIKDPAGGNCPNPELTYGGNQSGCRYYGTPSKVLGLLSEDLNCFVATAAYGSALDPHIDTFRKFRFKVLLRSELGKKLNYAYYNYGPKLSRFIKDRPWAQMTARAILWPAWGFASISLYLGLNTWQSLLLFLTTTSLFGYGLYLISRRLLGKGLIL